MIHTTKSLALDDLIGDLKMAFDDLIWKLWEIEEEIREKQQQEEKLRRRLRSLLQGREGTVKIVASSQVADRHGIESYELDFKKARFEFKALDKQGRTLMRAGWQRSDARGNQVTVVIEKPVQSKKLKIECSASKSEVILNGNRLSYSDFERPESMALIDEYHTYFRDFLVEVVEDMKQRRGAGGNGGSDNSKDALETIGDISCVCSTFGWIGLLICGPTCLGTIIAKAVDP